VIDTLEGGFMARCGWQKAILESNVLSYEGLSEVSDFFPCSWAVTHARSIEEGPWIAF